MQTSPALDLQNHVTAPVAHLVMARREVLRTLRSETNDKLLPVLLGESYAEILAEMDDYGFQNLVKQLKFRKAMDEAPTENSMRAHIWASMGLSSMIYKRTGAWRLYVLARSLDPHGSGHIRANALKAAALNLKVKPRTFAAWLAEALACGIFVKLFDGDTLRVRSQSEAFKIFGCKSLDKRKSELSLKQLFSKDWRARVFAAYVKANHDGEIISLEKLADLTGFPARTLKQDSMGKFVKSKRQYSILPQSADAVDGLNEYASRGKYFVFIDPANGYARRAAKHSPGRKSVWDNVARTAARGRRRAILAKLEHDGNLACDNRQLLSFQQADNRTIMRLFYSTPDGQGKTIEQAQRAKAKHEKTVIKLTQGMSRLPHDPREIFVQRGRRNVWDCMPLLDHHIFLSQ